MIPERLEDAKNNITRSRKGNIFAYESPAPGLHIYSNIWPDSMNFFNKIESDEYWEKDAYKKHKWVREDYLDSETGKKSRTCWISDDSEIVDNLEEVIDSYLYHWNLDPKSKEDMRITKFEGPGEFFGSHSDDTFATPRTASMVYYPNDNYDGGELEFIHFGLRIKPKAGQLFMFPSGYSYEHKVHPVNSGTRITMVSFFNSMTFDEVEDRRNSLNPNKYYQPALDYVFHENFGKIQPKYI
jgi:Rps23 Pro-64 3,4-dihydroxylase Tpa1-like proline 4-hydroxylase